MKWMNKRVRWATVITLCAAILIIGFMVINWQRNDLNTLNSRLQTVTTQEKILQYDLSEKQRELNIAGTSDYIAARARENGYVMPNEIRFVVKNPAVLEQYDTMDTVELEVSEAADDAAGAEEAGEGILPPAEASEGEQV